MSSASGVGGGYFGGAAGRMAKLQGNSKLVRVAAQDFTPAPQLTGWWLWTSYVSFHTCCPTTAQLTGCRLNRMKYKDSWPTGVCPIAAATPVKGFLDVKKKKIIPPAPKDHQIHPQGNTDLSL